MLCCSQTSLWTREQKTLLFAILALQLLLYACLSNMTPFFPLEASVKMVQESTIGFIFSANALTSTILSPIVGHFIIPKLGRKFVLFSGAWITGGAIIAFGFLDEIMDTSVFVQMCLIVRVVEAVGVSMCLTAGFSFLAQSFNEDIGFVMGLSEMSVGIGYLFGPSIGGSLYDVGGYELPFWLLGFTLLVSIPLIMYLLRNIDDNGDKRVSRRPTEAAVEIASHEAKPYELPSGLRGSQGRRPRVFPSFRFCFFACYVTFNAVTISFLETTLEPHLRPLGMSPGMVGLFFVVLSICYLAFGLVAGSISDRFQESQGTFCVIGMLCEAVAFLLVGPTPLFGLESTIWLNGIALTLMGFSFAFALIPTFAILFDSYGPQDEDDAVNIAMYSSVAGIWQSAYSFGEFIGPAVGGVMLENVQYPWSASIFGLLCLSSAGLVGGVEAVRRCRKSAANESVGPNLAKIEMDGEKTPLLLSASLHADRVKASF